MADLPLFVLLYVCMSILALPKQLYVDRYSSKEAVCHRYSVTKADKQRPVAVRIAGAHAGR